MLDISKMNFSENFFQEMKEKLENAMTAMDALVNGAISNPDEQRMVGHYWLRAPYLSPNKQIVQEINEVIIKIKKFAKKIHNGEIISTKGTKFKNILLIGIGGSALGPQFVTDALSTEQDKLKILFLDNTDPDGFDRVMAKLSAELAETLVLVISKSGGTKETINGLLEVKHYFEICNIPFSKQAIAITMKDSKLDKLAHQEEWLARFPLWDWVGGRTSQLSAVGLLPAALQGYDIDAILQGAAMCDELTLKKEIFKNPAAMLAAMWYYACQGNRGKVMVVLPYKDRLQLFGKYLQQLVMESLGKEMDMNKKVVHQGLYVLGNKGSTDQHSFVQQLLDGVDNFFATFIEVLMDRNGKSVQVEENVTSGDYLSAFLHGTKRAMSQKGRETITITVEKVDAFSIGMLIALFERAVGIYASLIKINAYHQPGVEAGKKGAQHNIEVQKEVIKILRNNPSQLFTVEDIASNLERFEEQEIIFNVLEHLRANKDHNIYKSSNTNILNSQYYYTN